uniref:Uncharacterized protein n=1 Tax=Acinetobacter phage vB_AbaM-SPB TaxID=3236747 RepID=A0AB39C8K6_9CAUD
MIKKYDKTFMPVLQIIAAGKNYFYCNDGGAEYIKGARKWGNKVAQS